MKLSRLAWIADGKDSNSQFCHTYIDKKRIIRRNLRAAAHLDEQIELEQIDNLSELDQKGLLIRRNARRN